MENHFLKHISDEIKKHGFDYFILSTLAIFFLLILNLTKGRRELQLIIFTVFIALYILWGIYHHRKDSSLSLKVLLEYILIGAIALLLLQALLLS